MFRVQLFTNEFNEDSLQEDINNFLRQHPKYEIINISYSVKENQYSNYEGHAMLLYENFQ